MTLPNCCCVAVAGLAICATAAAPSPPAPQANSSSFDSDGTAHVSRVIPMPSTVSPEAQKWLASLSEKKSQPQTLAERRVATDAWRKKDSAEARQLYPVNIEETSIAGVRTDVITPLVVPEANRSSVLINLHGGGFVSRGPSSKAFPYRTWPRSRLCRCITGSRPRTLSPLRWRT
jgi:monoterpene epsilon-lactone hydrolase